MEKFEDELKGEYLWASKQKYRISGDIFFDINEDGKKALLVGIFINFLLKRTTDGQLFCENFFTNQTELLKNKQKNATSIKFFKKKALYGTSFRHVYLFNLKTQKIENSVQFGKNFLIMLMLQLREYLFVSYLKSIMVVDLLNFKILKKAHHSLNPEKSICIMKIMEKNNKILFFHSVKNEENVFIQSFENNLSNKQFLEKKVHHNDRILHSLDQRMDALCTRILNIKEENLDAKDFLLSNKIIDLNESQKVFEKVNKNLESIKMSYIKKNNDFKIESNYKILYFNDEKKNSIQILKEKIKASYKKDIMIIKNNFEKNQAYYQNQIKDIIQTKNELEEKNKKFSKNLNEKIVQIKNLEKKNLVLSETLKNRNDNLSF